MIPVKRTMQISLVIMVCASGILLGLSQANAQLMIVGCFGAIAGFIIVDWLQLFQLKGWIANVASIAILLYSMSDFFDGNGAEKLISVSNLLVYLQTVLMFQEKNVRLNWQIMVLSLLQTVEAAIFNLNFEGGLLFIAYFAIAGVTMVLQSILAGNALVENSNRKSARRLGQQLLGRPATGHSPADAAQQHSIPIAIYDAAPAANSALGKIFRYLVIWLAIGLAFTTILFYSVPRGQQAWFGPKFRNMARTGFNTQVDIDEDGEIIPSNELVMRMWFQRHRSKKRTKVSGPVYIRGMALSSLVIEDGKTTWKAPHDRVNNRLYMGVPPFLRPGRQIVQCFTLEATQDPLIFAAMPAAAFNTPYEIEFCNEISALTRIRSSDKIEFSPYSYQFSTRIDSSNQLLRYWPYVSDVPSNLSLPMTQNRGQWNWLTFHEPERYPELIKVANEIARESRATGNEGKTDLFRRFENYLLDPARYHYTLDFRNVEKRPGVDPIEDFFTNHQSGHCELFASALTIMLRSQDIPARLVVGFHTGEFSDVTESYMIRKNHAHAWVEAYLAPKDCTPEMVRNGAANQFAGAWAILDATPPVDDLNSGSGTIELARTLWQDYVLGLDKENQPEDVFQSATKRMLGLFDLSNWSDNLESMTTQVGSNPLLQATLILAVLGAIFFGLFQNYRTSAKSRKKQRGQTGGKQVGVFRKLVGNALGLFSPNLQKWVLGESSGEITAAFYRKLTKMLGKLGLERSVGQTQREFAQHVGQHFSNHPDADSIAHVVNEVTDSYYDVRFGDSELDKAQIRQIEQELAALERQLATPGNASGV